MFGFMKKVTVPTLDINEAYQQYLNHPDDIIIINVDELVNYDERHIADSENLPFRLVKDFEEYYPDKSKKYYIYSLGNGKAYNSAKTIIKLGYEAYELSSYIYFKGDEEGLSVKKKRRKKRK